MALATRDTIAVDVAMVWHTHSFVGIIVEAAINYAYTGSITISAANVTRIYLLAHNLGSDTIASWCVDFLRTRWVKLFWELQPTVLRISLDNVSEVWSVTNVAPNRGLMELCVPLMTEHFEILCLRSKVLMQTTAEYFEVMLEKKRQRGTLPQIKLINFKWQHASKDNVYHQYHCADLPTSLYTSLSSLAKMHHPEVVSTETSSSFTSCIFACKKVVECNHRCDSLFGRLYPSGQVLLQRKIQAFNYLLSIQRICYVYCTLLKPIIPSAASFSTTT
ncbi:hypothetical protein EGR_04502 [Echinococcus granulosus]|uniref:BTB domain-containing protein n=1 Tax=Echinococcus granulosus TaxID=6210 RepID=W6V3Q3_ECHGR|nr:hypothetical protein EGR_04502 [Echinococcus granulosus]EUB60669.1 hypothetical protein EGR_04502 [Echinococcus granulosus]